MFKVGDIVESKYDKTQLRIIKAIIDNIYYVASIPDSVTILPAVFTIHGFEDYWKLQEKELEAGKIYQHKNLSHWKYKILSIIKANDGILYCMYEAYNRGKYELVSSSTVESIKGVLNI